MSSHTEIFEQSESLLCLIESLLNKEHLAMKMRVRLSVPSLEEQERVTNIGKRITALNMAKKILLAHAPDAELLEGMRRLVCEALQIGKNVLKR
jgi:hypothetical protein